jgi:hypothetical protein
MKRCLSFPFRRRAIDRKWRFAFVIMLAATAMPATGSSTDQDALLPLDYDRERGVLTLTVPMLERPLLYSTLLASGVGSTQASYPATMLDRSESGSSAIVHFERHGERVLLVQRNSVHLASTGEAAARAVAESFPSSVLAALPITGEHAGRLQVDATSLFLQDGHGVAASLKFSGLGNAKLDASRSYIDPQATRSHARNTEVRAVLTFAVEEPASELAKRAPDARSLTVAQHHSFTAVPDDDYRPRAFHPRVGMQAHVVLDYGQPLDHDYRRRAINRWRLEPADPAAYLAGRLSAPVKPIVYLLDPAIPEPYRQAFREGALWWNEAFEAAGFRDAIVVRDLPDGLDPLDARYNSIQWVHRGGPGPSVGPSHVDPRSGEIVRTVVRMDSHRSLVNHDLWMGFLPAAPPTGPALDSEAMAMARRRQHSSHEIGHTIGLNHNHIAAMQGRSSVMDYPVPRVSLDANGHIDLSQAYSSGIGAFDRFAIRYAYAWFPDADSERAGLAAIVEELDRSGLRSITDSDALNTGSEPNATLWVEGDGAFDAWQRGLSVRQALVEAFDVRALAAGEPYSTLNRRFAHVYLHHRPALYALIKFVGGNEQRYALAGDGMLPTAPIAAAEQHRALAAFADALSSEVLRIPTSVLDLVAAEPPGWAAHDDPGNPSRLLPLAGGTRIDATHIAHALAQEQVSLLLHPARMARVAAFNAGNPAQPGIDAVCTVLLDASWGRSVARADLALLQVIQRAVLDGFLDLAGDSTAGNDVRNAAHACIAALESRLRAERARGEPMQVANRQRALADIERFHRGEDSPALRPRPSVLALPWP